MLRSNSLIQEFLIPVPGFCLTNGLTDLWSHLNHPERWIADRLVLINQEELPIGLIYLHSLIPYLNSDEPFLSSQDSLILPQPQSAIIRSLLQPLQIIPGTLSVKEFWSYLAESQNQESDQTQELVQEWAVVNPEGKFLGLLDTKALLRVLVNEYQLEEVKSPQTGEDNRLAGSMKMTRAAEPEELTHTLGANQILDHLKQPAIALIQQVIDLLPWPVKMQTPDGQTSGENLAWRQAFGEFSDTQISVMPSTASGNESTDLSEDLSEPVSTRVNHLLTDDDSDPIVICSLGNGGEQDWKFFKLPLELDLSSGEINSMLASAGLVNSKTDQHYSEDSQGKKLRSPPTDRFESDRKKTTGDPETESQVGSLSWWLIIAEDVTEQQQVAKELVAKNADLVQLNRLKDEFLACISHELKTPLTAVLGLSSLLKDQALGPLNERQARYAKMIHQSGQHLMRVVNDILDLTRIETGQLQLNWEPVQIHQVCEEAWNHTEETQKSDAAGGHRVESSPRFTLDIEPGLNMIVVDHLRLRQMLYNLLSNAFKFTSPDGVIGLNVSRWEDWIAFTVSDTGIGIPADKQHLIFQRFQQLENPLTRRFEGTGLGLVLTQGLARAHGGDVTFISKEEQGSQFTILLPSAPSEPGTIQEFPVRDQRLLLIVDAVPQYIEDLNDQLVRLGYRVVISRCGLDALEKARHLQPSVIFVNPLLPLLSGWDLLTLLKSDPQTHQIPVIMTATVVDKKRAKKFRADGCLSLPISASELEEQLDRLVSLELPETTADLESKLTIIRLTAHLEKANTVLLQGLRIQSGQYQILEADDLEQAEMLAEIWQPQVILIESASDLPEPQVFFQTLSESTLLANLPIVTMDLATTEAANQVPGLMIFPCLVNEPPREKQCLHNNDGSSVENSVQSTHSENMSDRWPHLDGESSLPPASYLLQVIQLAVQMKGKPNILAVDLLTLPEFYHAHDKLHSHPEIDSNDANPKKYSKFYNLRDLISEIKSADLNASIGRSWSEVWQKLQQQSVDLLLVYLPVEDLVPPIVNGLKAIAQMNHKPPILLIKGQGRLLSTGESASSVDPDHNPEIIDRESLSVIKSITTKIVPNSMSKEELLQQIKQLLHMRQSHHQKTVSIQRSAVSGQL
jgi:signal transduction histidine kinase/DNA-binding response OmpR family regulator